nr:MAG TPA: hypothetical protein [Bacteriophage sp.]
MNDLISKSKLKNELSKIPSEMGLIKKVWVMQAVDKQKVQDSNNTCNCQHNNNSRGNEPCCRCDSKQTNADRIRNMSDEELTEFLVGFKNTFGEEYEGEASCMEWLQSEAE